MSVISDLLDVLRALGGGDLGEVLDDPNEHVELTELVAGLPGTRLELYRAVEASAGDELGVWLAATARGLIAPGYEVGDLDRAIEVLRLVRQMPALVERRRFVEENDSWAESINHLWSDHEYDLLTQRAESWAREVHGRPLAPDEQAGIHAACFGVDGEEDYRTKRAVDVVLHRMLDGWIRHGRCESETTFFAHRLQLLEGRGGQALSRDSVRRRINAAIDRYGPESPTKTRDLIAVAIMFPDAPGQLFNFDDGTGLRPFTEFRLGPAVRRREPPPESAVSSWRCDSCGRTCEPGSAPTDIMPSREGGDRIDKRLVDHAGQAPHRSAGTIRSLPKIAWAGDSFMCSCWRERAGILQPILT